MNMSVDWVEFLSDYGITVKHWSELGDITASDSEIMHYAAAENFTILTQDLDFGTLLSAGELQRPSVVQIRADHTMPSAIGEATIAALRQLEEELHSGALVTIAPEKTRLRPLPFGRRKPQF